jgi:hypothetical protein
MSAESRFYNSGRSVLVLCFFFFFVVLPGTSQTIPLQRLSNWSAVGIRVTPPVPQNYIDFSLSGGVGDGVTPNNSALQSVLSSLAQPAVIFFPPGNYLFTQPIDMPDGVIFRGAGSDQTTLTFNLNGAGSNLITIQGNTTGVTSGVNSPINKFDTLVTVANSTAFSAGDYVYLNDVDTAVVFSAWAYGSSGQVNQITSVSGNTLILRDECRRSYSLANSPLIRKIAPASFCGIECLKINRLDATTTQTSAVAIRYARDCWVRGVESNNCNFAHVEISWSTDIDISGNYFHHAFAYGGGGQAYGVVLQYATGQCLVTNNCFNNLRHSILFQAGANGNVVSYNYSVNPYWTSFPNNSAGDVVLHGNYPYCNLIEGNIAQNIVIDASHGINGSHNLFFRNRAELYGIIMSANPASDSMLFVGNEVTNTSVLMGNYSLNGVGHFGHGNMVRGNLTPANTGMLPEESYYLNVPYTWMGGWPGIGVAYPYNTGTIPAKTRFSNQLYTDCSAVITQAHSASPSSVAIFPTIVEAQLTITGPGPSYRASLFNASGKMVMESISASGEQINLSHLSAGLYFVIIVDGAEKKTFRIVKL